MRRIMSWLVVACFALPASAAEIKVAEIKEQMNLPYGSHPRQVLDF